MRRNNKRLFFNILYVVLIIVVIYTCINVILILKSNAKQCIDNPFIYGARNVIKGEAYCSCYEDKGDGYQYPFYFNSTTWWAEVVKKPLYEESNVYKGQELNYSSVFG